MYVSLCIQHLDHNAGIPIGIDNIEGQFRWPVWRYRGQAVAYIQGGYSRLRLYISIHALANRIHRQHQNEYNEKS